MIRINALTMLGEVFFDRSVKSSTVERVVQVEELLSLVVKHYNKETNDLLGDLLEPFETRCGMLNADQVFKNYYDLIYKETRRLGWDRRLKIKIRYKTMVVGNGKNRTITGNMAMIEMDLDRTIEQTVNRFKVVKVPDLLTTWE